MNRCSRVGSATEDVVKDIVNLIEGDEVSDRALKHAIEAPGYFIGLPTGQIANTSQYRWDLVDGEQQPENVLQFMTGLAKGPQEDQE